MTLNFASIAMRLALVLVLAGLWLLFQAAPSHACSCITPGSPSEELAKSAVVFAGTVVSLDRSLVKSSSLDPVIVEFDIKTVWKGQPAHRMMEFTTPESSASCGYSFVEGVEYLVYSRNGLEVSLCSRTRPLSQAAGDLAELGQGQPPTEGTTAPTPAVTEQPPPPTPVAPGQPVGGGCGPSPHSDGLLMAGLVVGIAWLGLGKRRSIKRR